MLIKLKKIKTDYPYKGKILSLRVDEVLLPNGGESRREIVEHGGVVAIVPFVNESRIVLIRQYRHAIEETILEIPAGLLEPGEDIYKCAARELTEETGFRAAKLEKLTEYYPAPEFSNQMTYIFKATCLEQVGAKLDEDEYLEVVTMDLDEIIKLIAEDRIKDSKTIIGLLFAKKGAR